jgi:hypothetical protein
MEGDWFEEKKKKHVRSDDQRSHVILDDVNLHVTIGLWHTPSAKTLLIFGGNRWQEYKNTDPRVEKSRTGTPQFPPLFSFL